MENSGVVNWDLGAINVRTKDLQTAFSESLGMPLPPNITLNKMHRFKIGDRKDLSGWIFMPTEDVAIYGDWSTGFKYYWFAESCADYKTILTNSFNAIAKDLESVHLMTANKCRSFFAQEYPEGESDYIKRKQIFKADNCVVLDNVLHVPIYNWNSKGKLGIVGEQVIYANGDKKFSYGLKKKGSFGYIGSLSERVILCEGYATACSLHLATKLPVIIALDAGNIYSCVENILSKKPQCTIVICADNDYKDKDGNIRDLVDNVGVAKASYVAKKFDLKVFTLQCAGTDANDYHLEFGLDKLKEQLAVYGVTPPICQVSIPIQKDYKAIKLPHCRGIMQKIFRNCYEREHIQRTRWTMSATIVTYQAIIGNIVKTGSIHPNINCMILGPSKYGKNIPLRYPLSFFSEIGYREPIVPTPGSSAGILVLLKPYCSQIHTYDEGSTLFRATQSKDLWASSMAEAYCDIYSSAGGVYTGKSLKAEATKIIPSPISIIHLATTISSFQSDFSSKLMAGGLGRRFLYFPDLEFKDDDDRPDVPIPTELKDFVFNLRTMNKISEDLSADRKIINIPLTESAKNLMKKINKHPKFNTTDDNPIAPLITSGPERVRRFALMDVTSMNWQRPFHELKIDVDNIEAGLDMALGISEGEQEFMTDNLEIDIDMTERNKVLSIVREAGPNGVARSELLRKFRKSYQRLDHHLRTLRDSALIQSEIDDLYKTKPATKYWAI